MKKQFIMKTIAFAISIAMVIPGVGTGNTYAEETDISEPMLEEAVGNQEIVANEKLVIDEEEAVGDSNSYGLSNPVRDKDDEGGVTTYSYVYFGTYPQAEVVASKNNYTAIGSDYLQPEDLIEDEILYNKLQNAVYDTNKITTITYNGSTYQYKRMRKSYATYSTIGDNSFYNWPDSNVYHYFRLEPIKWRVLSVSGNDAFLMADKGIDSQRYHTHYSTVYWEESTIRSWLNGYDASANDCATNYVGKGFIDIAFNDSEKTAINMTSVEDVVSGESYYTEDKVFLLSEDEVYSNNYGFASSCDIYDKARMIKTSAYAKAMGVCWDIDSDYAGNSNWWLRTSGSNIFKLVMNVLNDGRVKRDGYSCACAYYSVCPALHLNIATALWSTSADEYMVKKAEALKEKDSGSDSSKADGCDLSNPVHNAEGGDNLRLCLLWYIPTGGGCKSAE